MRKVLLITIASIFSLVSQLEAQTTDPGVHQPYKHGLFSPTRGSFIKNKSGKPGANPAENEFTGQSGTGANIDVVYHRANWTIDPRTLTNIISGTVVTYFKTIVSNVSAISMDLHSNFNNGSLVITYHGTTCSKSFTGKIVNITLPVTIAAVNTLDSFVINYSGVPPAVSGAAQGYQKGTGALGASPNQYTGSLSESYEDRDWWPCKADMQDKIDSMDINVTVPWNNNAAGDTFWVAANGRLYDSTINVPGLSRTFKFKTRYPIASYLVAVSVAKFKRYYRSVTINGTVVPVAYYILRNTPAITHTNATAAMDKINPVLDSLSRRWGDYPFKLEKHGFYDGLNGAGGMEHQTFSAIANNALTSLGTLVHELAHQWFGNNVTFATWNDLWLAEGPARFSEVYAAEKVPALGNSAASVHAMKTTLKSDAQALSSQSAWIPNGNMGTSALIWSSPYGSTVYDRGAMVITMLRTLAGEVKFNEAMTSYQTALAGKSATGDSLRNHFNTALGTDINEFFRDYVGGSGKAATAVGGVGHPTNNMIWNTPATNKLVVKVNTQTVSSGSNVTYFNGPVAMHFTNALSGWTKDTMIVIYDWGGGNLSYAGNGLSEPIPGNALNFDLSFTPTHAFFDDSAKTLSNGTMTRDAAFVGYTWNGGTSAAWNTTNNWVNTVVPPSGAQVAISTTVNQPVLPGTITVDDLYLSPGSKLNIGNNTLLIKGTVTGTGTLTGSSVSNITINGAAGTLNFDQTSSSTRSINNLIINAAGSATLGSAMEVYGTITLNTATLNLNAKNMTLKSNSAGTARIADLTGSTLTGATNVTVERYIKLRTPGTADGSGNNGRAYRLLAPGVNSTGSIRTNWMEGGMNTVIGTNVNPVPGFGTHISGAGGNAGGFDVTATNNASLYATTNAVTPTYTPITSTTGTLNALTGYFLYLRGDRSVSVQVPLGTNMPTTHTTLRTTGTIVTGTQNSFTNAFAGGGALNLVTNPYPSPIDWSLVRAACTNVTNFYTIWDPNIGTRGGFVTVNTAGTPSAGTATKFIQPGQAFFVESSGGVPTVSIMENHKAAGNNNTVFLVEEPPVESFKAGLYFIEDSGYRRQSDGITVMYNDAYSTTVDDEDAKEIGNWDENIAVYRENKRLAIESRPVIITRDTIPLYMNNMKQRSYEFEFVPLVFTHIGLKAELIDRFLNTRTTLSVVDTVTVNFTVTADPASAATDRFMVVFGPSFTLAIDALSIKARAKYLPASQGGNHIQVDWTAKTEKDMDRYELERSFDGVTFTKINSTVAVGNSTVPLNYSWNDVDPMTGTLLQPADNFYRVKAIDKAGLTKYTAVVKVSFGNPVAIVSTIGVYPNPVKGNSFSLQLNDIAKGSYGLTIINTIGQTMYRTQVQHAGGSAILPVLAGKLAKGLYEVVLTGEHERISARLVKL